MSTPRMGVRGKGHGIPTSRKGRMVACAGEATGWIQRDEEPTMQARTQGIRAGANYVRHTSPLRQSQQTSKQTSVSGIKDLQQRGCQCTRECICGGEGRDSDSNVAAETAPARRRARPRLAKVAAGPIGWAKICGHPSPRWPALQVAYSSL